MVVALAFTGCAQSHVQPATEVLVVVNSDLAIGTQLTSIHVQVKNKAGDSSSTSDERNLALVPKGVKTARLTTSYELPLSFSVVPPKGGDDSRFRLVVTGLLDTQQVVEQQVIVTFQPGKTVLLPVFLSVNCFERLCRDEQNMGKDVVCAALGGLCDPVPTAKALATIDPKTSASTLAQGGTSVSLPGLCGRGGSSNVVTGQSIAKVDMLFMVDNSDSMAEKQTLLRAQFPHLITVMTTGDIDADGKNDFPPAKDLHLGVVTSDMGLPGIQGIQNCTGLGQDGILQSRPSAAVMGCQASYPPFLTFQAGINNVVQSAQDFACIAQVGTGGCGFEYQLEAALKALWPKTDPNPVNGMNRIRFLFDPRTGKGADGHGDVENIGFLRNDPVQGPSLIAVIVLTDEDDCSASDTTRFTPPQFLNPGDPLAMEGMNLRCHFDQSHRLYPVDRYINGFKALRPGNENLVIFGAIVGVPPDLTGPDVLMNTDFSNPVDRDQFYKNILNDPRMKETVDNMGTPDPSDDKLVHSCVSNVGKGDPPIRIVQVASAFGENGIVQSICQNDYGPALDAILARLGARLKAPCP